MRVLYVEDDPRDADITVRMLRKSVPDIQVETVTTIEQATARLERLTSDPLDLVLTDVHLSDGDGLLLLEHIREMAYPVAVVVITGMGDEETAVSALKARADDYVVKHRDYLDRLHLTLASAVNHYRADSARRSRTLNILYADVDSLAIENTRRHFSIHADHIHLEVVSSWTEMFLTLERQDTRYDVLLLDYQLPEITGLEALHRLRHIYQFDVPAVLVCAEADQELARQGLKVGATSCIVKSPGYLHQLPWELEEAHARAELRRREAALQESEGRFRMIADTAPVFVWITDKDKLCTYVNQPWLEFTGRTMDQELGYGWADTLHPDDRQSSVDTYDTAFNERGVLRMEYRSKRHDGEYRWVLATGVPRFTPDGSFIGYVGSAVDITERKETEISLRESEERLRLAQQAARVGTWELHVPTGMSVWSEMIWHFLGLEPGECEPTLETFIEFLHPEDRDSALHTIKEVLAEGEDYYDEFRVVRRDGQIVWLSSQGRLIRSADGRAERMLGVNINITERKLANEALKHALAEVQTLKDRLQEENVYLKEEIRVASNFGEMIGESESLKRVEQLAEQVAPLDTTVLILGETGTGKELLAHGIHNGSPRQNRPLVKVNCATLPADLIESELFGHEKGAFTGASARRLGRFQLANSGTLFLDEVGELPLELQAKLLRVLQEGEFDPVGSTRTVKVDVRVIAATNRNLAEAVQLGLFRSDLYYRLTIFPITLPPLRERPKDIPLLIRHFVQEFSRKFGKQIDTIPHEAMVALKNYPWPGNIRELRNVIERAVIVTQGTKLSLESLESLTTEATSEAEDVSPHLRVDGGETLEQNQHNLILQTLKRTYWRIEGPYGAAAALNVHPSTLRSLMKKHGISRPKVRTQGVGKDSN